MEHGKDTWRSEESMRSYNEMAHDFPIGPSFHAKEIRPFHVVCCNRGRLARGDLTCWLPQLWEAQSGGRPLVQALEGIERRIVSLRNNIERGNYSVEAEQIAEKIVKDILFGFLHL